MDLAASAEELRDRLEFLEHIEKRGDGYVLLSHKGKVLGKFKTRAEAEKREKQVVYFKNKGG